MDKYQTAQDREGDHRRASMYDSAIMQQQRAAQQPRELTPVEKLRADQRDEVNKQGARHHKEQAALNHQHARERDEPLSRNPRPHINKLHPKEQKELNERHAAENKAMHNKHLHERDR